MAFDRHDRPKGDRQQRIAEGDKTLFAATLALALVAALGLRAVLSVDALAPAVASLLFALAAFVACSAFLLRRRTRMLDLAGILTFVGILVSLMIESDQMTRLMVLSDQSESN